MRKATFFRQTAALALSAAMVLSTQFVTMANADIVGTNAVIAKYGQNTNRDYLLSQLQTKEVRDELVKAGVDPAEAQARVAALSDQEIRSMLAQFDQQNAGGDGVLGTLLTVFVILLITDFLCLTRIFKFTRCVR